MGASFVFLFLFLHLGRAMFYGSYFYNPNTWFSGIVLFFFLMAIAFMGYVLPFGQMSFWGATVITNFLSPFPCLIELSFAYKKEVFKNKKSIKSNLHPCLFHVIQ